MTEAADDANNEAQVIVQEAAKQEDDKTRALRKLEAIIGIVTAHKELEAAIQQAEAAGAVEEELEKSKERVIELKAKSKAKKGLKMAIEECTVRALQEAIEKAQEIGLPESDSDYAEAREVLAVERPKQDARDGLQAAARCGSIDAMKQSIAEAKRVGLESAQLLEFEDLVATAESKEKAELVLNQSIEDKDIAKLKFTIEQARNCGVDGAQVAQAEEVLKVEEPKQDAREVLQQAVEKNTKEALREAISRGKEVGLQALECAEAEQALDKLEDQERKYIAVQQSVEDSLDADMSGIDSVRMAKDHLAEAISAAIQAGVPETDLQQAELRRKKLHNTVEDLKGSIRVFCRVRPLGSRELKQGDSEVTKQLNPITLQVGLENKFQFDAVWTPGTQDEIFEDCKDLVQSAVDGYNVTLFAYGQTGAGKTFTMAGVPGQLGVSPRTITEIFQVIEGNKSRFTYTVMGSMLELYQNTLVDLLSKEDPKASKQKLNVRVEKSGMVAVEHLKAEECKAAKDLQSLMDRGNKSRSVAATAMNSESSRSHLVLMIQIISRNKETGEQLRGKMLIVDLAGSERLKKSQTTEDQQKESIEINKSLTALGDVIEALTKGSKVIPYRNHKLTQLMQDALGGTAKTLMFVNCSPSSSNKEETLNSLKYAQRAKKITNVAVKGK